jgi:integrase
VRDRIIVENPASGVTLPKRRRHHIAMTIPTPKQVVKALDAAPDDFRAYVTLCAFACLRLGEAAAIRVGDLERVGHILRIRGQVQGQVRGKQEVVARKAGSERDVPIPESLTELLTLHVQTIGPTARSAGRSSQATPCSTTTAPATMTSAKARWISGS